MSGEASQRALKRLVADLALLDDDDIDAILGELDPAGRAQMSNLLRAYRTGAADPTNTTASPPAVSGWLDRRLSDTGATALTPTTRDTLRRLGSSRSSAPAAPPSASRRPGLDLLGRWR